MQIKPCTVLLSGLCCASSSDADRACLQSKRLFKATCRKETFILKDLSGWGIRPYHPFVENNSPLTEFQHHIEIVSCENFRVGKIA